MISRGLGQDLGRGSAVAAGMPDKPPDGPWGNGCKGVFEVRFGYVDWEHSSMGTDDRSAPVSR
jgi:hypothetical protein